MLGDPTEAALIVAAEKAGLSRAGLERDYPRVGEIPFDSETKRMVTVHRTPEGGTVAYVKGSPDALLEASRSRSGPAASRPSRRAIGGAGRSGTGNWPALPCACWAWRTGNCRRGTAADDLGQDLVFVGLVGMIDPLRDEAKAAIATCREAGIRTDDDHRRPAGDGRRDRAPARD